LHGTDDIHVPAGGEDLEIITGQPRRWRRHGNEIQKEVGAEHDEYESEKDASNDGGGFHSSILFGLIRNSNLKRGLCLLNFGSSSLFMSDVMPIHSLPQRGERVQHTAWTEDLIVNANHSIM